MNVECGGGGGGGDGGGLTSAWVLTWTYRYAIKKLLHECNSNFKLFDHKPSASKLSTECFHILYFPIHVVRNSDQVP